MSDWIQQRRDDYADGYEFARQEMLANGERVEPDYEAAFDEYLRATAKGRPMSLHPKTIVDIVRAAIGRQAPVRLSQGGR